jgi:hypothetical protein
MVVPDVFIIHWDHGTPSWRKKGDLIRARVWQNYFEFLEEIIMHYNTKLPDYIEEEHKIQKDDSRSFYSISISFIIICFILMLLRNIPFHESKNSFFVMTKYKQ